MKKHIFTKKINYFLLFISLCVSSAVLADTPVNTEKKSLMESIIDRYTQASNTNKTLKHLLDAKMELFSAEHDLLVSHNKIRAKNNIENTIASLLKAEELAKPPMKNQIVDLINQLKPLEQKTINNSQSGSNDDIDKLLKIVQSKLLEASKHVESSPSTKQEIEKINEDIQKLRNEIEHTNLKTDYESIMHTLNAVIDDI